MVIDTPARSEGNVAPNGAEIHFQVFGEGKRTILLLPTWSIVHSDFWRHQVQHLARRYTVVTFDGLGNGRSDRSIDPALYDDRSFAADAVAVLDSVGVETVVPMSASQGGCWGLVLAATVPDRIAASVFIAPNVPLSPARSDRAAAFAAFDSRLDDYDGWFKFNRHYWNENWADFLQFFFSQCFTEPDSDAEIRHFVEMGLETTPAVIAATIAAPGINGDTTRALASSIRSPVLVLHGDEDAITPTERGQELAKLTGGDFILLSGSGHEPQCRNPQEVNHLLDNFLDRHFAA
jgi:pimeloyl-ACP methyl ester carboxylesterase